jgi:hypothetical protein
MIEIVTLFFSEMERRNRCQRAMEKILLNDIADDDGGANNGILLKHEMDHFGAEVKTKQKRLRLRRNSQSKV